MTRLGHDHQVAGHRPVVDVVEVEAHRLLPASGRTGRRPATGRSGPGRTSSRRCTSWSYCSTSDGSGRARTHQAHVAAQHVEQLRQLVEGVAPQEPADRRDAGVVLDLEEHAVGLVVVRRRSSSRSSASTTIERNLTMPNVAGRRGPPVPAGRAPGRRRAASTSAGDDEQDGREQDQRDAGEHDVEQALGAPRAAAPACGCSTCSSGRPATGRMWIRGPATSVRLGHHDEVDVRALERPGDAAQLLRGVIAARATSTVSAPTCVTRAAARPRPDRARGRRSVPARRRRRAAGTSTDDLVADVPVRGAARRRPRRYRRRCRRPRSPGAAAAPAARPMRCLAHGVPLEQEQRRPAARTPGRRRPAADGSCSR